MSKRPSGNPNGRPPKEIDKELFEKLCLIQCTEIEMLEVLDVGKDKLIRWCKDTYGDTFENTFKRKSSKGKMSLRRKQFEIAQSGNTTMLIWLGKQYLEQTDKSETDNTNNDNVTITFGD